MKIQFFALCISLISTSLIAEPYELNFVGLKDEKVLKAIFDASDLVTLQDMPPKSLNALRYRMQADVPSIIKVLHAYGYYDAEVTTTLENEENGLQVYIFIRPGTVYQIGSYDIFQKSCNEPFVLKCCQIENENLGIKIGSNAISSTLVNAELSLLTQLSKCGYPLARIENRKIEVDMSSKKVFTKVCLDEGPFSQFGPITITGLKEVKQRFVKRRIDWRQGDLYNSEKIDEFQKRLLNTNLFSSVLVSHDEMIDDQGNLPVKIKLTEAKHRQFSIGAFYGTVEGPGISFAWNHRNIRGMGESLSLSGEISERYYAGTAVYRKPDFLVEDQTLKMIGEIYDENIYAYNAFSYRFGSFVERKFDTKRNFSLGIEVENIDVTHSANNAGYLLANLPIMWKINTSDNNLNPTTGYTLVYQAFPYQSLNASNHHFIKQRVTSTFYIPVVKKNFIFATRVQVGSIAGAKQETIPIPVLFLGGSEDDLRGYRYMTVSPLNEHNKPLGGRSAIFLSFETRFRFGENIGIVPFFDLGTVSFHELPQVTDKWYRSYGIGLRYFTFFGPLRFDVGIPLDKRKHVDDNFRIYASIGQTF